MSSTGGGYIYGAESDDRFLSGNTVCLIAKPDAGKFFQGWSVKAGDNTQFEILNNPCELTISDDISAIATFGSDLNADLRYVLTVAEPDIGKILVSGDQTQVAYGPGVYQMSFSPNDAVVLTVDTQGDGDFICWNDGNADNPREFVVNKDKFAYPIIQPAYDPSETVIVLADSGALRIASAIPADGNKISIDIGE